MANIPEKTRPQYKEMIKTATEPAPIAGKVKRVGEGFKSETVNQ